LIIVFTKIVVLNKDRSSACTKKMNSMDTPLNSHIVLKALLELEYAEMEYQVSILVQQLKNRTPIKTESVNTNNLTKRELIDLLSISNIQYHPQSTTELFIHSLFISAYSFFEHSLKKLAEIVALQSNISKRKVFNFEKVHQYFSYLTNDIGLDRKEILGTWDQMNIYRDIRNSIMHHNSSIGKNITSRTYQFLKEDERIEFIEPSGFRIKNEMLIMDLIASSREIMMHLIDQFDEKIRIGTK
jgi:hypothetical protein